MRKAASQPVQWRFLLIKRRTVSIIVVFCAVASAASPCKAESAFCLAAVTARSSQSGKIFDTGPFTTNIHVFPGSRWPSLYSIGQGWLFDTPDGRNISGPWPFPSSYFDVFFTEPGGRVIGRSVNNGQQLYAQSPQTGRFAPVGDVATPSSIKNAIRSAAWSTAFRATVVVSARGLYAVRENRLEPLRGGNADAYLMRLRGILDLPALEITAFSTLDGQVLLLDGDLNVQVVPGIDAGAGALRRMVALPDGSGLLVQTNRGIWTARVEGHGPSARVSSVAMVRDVWDSSGDLRWYASADAFLFSTRSQNFWLSSSPATLWRLDGNTMSELLRWSTDDPQQFFFREVPSRKIILIQDGPVTHAYSASRGLSVLIDGHDPEVGTFQQVADIASLDVVLISTTNGVFSLEPDLTLKAIVLPSDMQYLHVGSAAYMPAWGVAVFADQTGIWSMGHDKVFSLIVREPLRGLGQLTALPSGSGVYVEFTKQGDAVLLREPAGAAGRCLSSAPQKG